MIAVEYNQIPEGYYLMVESDLLTELFTVTLADERTDAIAYSRTDHNLNRGMNLVLEDFWDNFEPTQ